MKGNFPNESKNRWTRIFRKKWIFPALYIMLAAFLLTAVLWYQSIERKLSEGMEEFNQADNLQDDPFEDEIEAVIQQKETIKMPVADNVQTEIVTKFFDYDADEADKEDGLILYNDRYYQSKGIDIATVDGETFDVVASLSGTVKEVKPDPLNGNVVVMEHGKDITTYYASLDDVDVTVGTKLKQGAKIGTAGKSLFGQENGIHVHFEMRKGDTEVNPEDFFNKSVAMLEQFDGETVPSEPDEGEDSDSDDDKKSADDEDEDGESDKPKQDKPVPNPNPFDEKDGNEED